MGGADVVGPCDVVGTFVEVGFLLVVFLVDDFLVVFFVVFFVVFLVLRFVGLLVVFLTGFLVVFFFFFFGARSSR